VAARSAEEALLRCS